MKKIEFFVNGTPQGKGRPRFFRGHAVTPAKTAQYEKLVHFCFRQALNQERLAGGSFDRLAGPVRVTIKAFFDVPKSYTKRVRAQIAAGDVRPTKKPDADNIAKIIIDALNRAAYEDDAQVVECRVEKHYAERAGVLVCIEDLTGVADG